MDEHKEININEICNLEDFQTFLMEHDYNWMGLSVPYNINKNIEDMYGFSIKRVKTLNNTIIVLEDKSIWGKKVEGTTLNARAVCEKNPYIRYIEQNGATFKVYRMARKKFGPGESVDYQYTFNNVEFVLEKDLSAEWIKYLAQTKPQYAQYMLSRCEQRKHDLMENYNVRKQIIADKRKRLDAEEIELRHSVEHRMETYKQLEAIIKSAQKEQEI